MRTHIQFTLALVGLAGAVSRLGAQPPEVAATPPSAPSASVAAPTGSNPPAVTPSPPPFIAATAACVCRSPQVDNDGDGVAESCFSAVLIDEDSAADLNCDEELHVGKRLADSDGDGIPDACGDRCPCIANPPTADGLIPDCPVLTETTPTATLAPPEAEPPATSPTYACVDGQVTGFDGPPPVSFFLRPRSLAYDGRGEAGSDSLRLTAGLYGMAFVPLERNWGCLPTADGSIEIIDEIDWYLRFGVYASPSNVNWGNYAADIGPAWHPRGQVLSYALLGHLLRTDTDIAQLGVSFSVSVYDVISLGPLVQYRLNGDGSRPLSFGGLLSFDLGVLRDLGVHREGLVGLLDD